MGGVAVAEIEGEFGSALSIVPSGPDLGARRGPHRSELDEESPRAAIVSNRVRWATRADVLMSSAPIKFVYLAFT